MHKKIINEKKGHRMKGAYCIGLCIAGLAASPLFAVSYSLNPWVTILEPDKGNISQIITLTYVGDEVKDGEGGQQGTLPIPVELTLFPRSVSPEGKVTYDTSVTVEEFTLFPSQIILYPGDVQKVQLHWVGEKIPKRELAYGLISSQLPVNLQPVENLTVAKGMVTVLTRYEAVILVRPKGAKPNVKVDSAGIRLEDSLPKLVVNLTNNGTGLQILREMELTVIALNDQKPGKGQTRTRFKPKSHRIKQALQAGESRELVLDWPSDIPQGKVQVLANFE
jgi:P pilus assembly chaperone PapD